MVSNLMRIPVLFVVVALPSVAAADPDIDAIHKDTNRRAAWDRLVERGPKVLPLLLDGMDTRDTAAANWLRTAFDRIIDRELAGGGKKIDVEQLLAYAKDAKRVGRARRLALDVVEQLKPGTREALVAGWLDDPEFRFDAVAEVVKKADTLTGEQAKKELQRAFDHARDIEQVKGIAVKLDKAGTSVSVAKHLGFLLDWHVAGPFDAKEQKGFKTVYPPEEKVDLTAEMQGKSGPLKWIHYSLKEPSPSAGGRFGLIDLLKPLGTHHDAVAYAFTTIHVDKAIEAEFRGAADDNFSVWVNGKRVFGFEEYRNGVRHDHHRFKVMLKEGDNTVLVKIVQAPFDASSPEANWEFLLRVVDADGRGLSFESKKK